MNTELFSSLSAMIRIKISNINITKINDLNTKELILNHFDANVKYINAFEKFLKNDPSYENYSAYAEADYNLSKSTRALFTQVEKINHDINGTRNSPLGIRGTEEIRLINSYQGLIDRFRNAAANDLKYRFPDNVFLFDKIEEDTYYLLEQYNL